MESKSAVPGERGSCVAPTWHARMFPPTRRPGRPAALVAALLLFTGCSILNAPGGGVNLISVDDEWQMGRDLSAEVDRQMHVISDPGTDAYLSRLGHDLLAVSNDELARLEWTFHLVDDDAINAFNLPGGHVYVNTGLVRALTDHAELASVVGHEIGHGLARHGTRQLTKQLGLSALLAIALGDDPSSVEELVAIASAQGTLLKFSRDDELEADRTGIHLLYGAGIDPEGTVDMLKVLAALQEHEPSRMERFLASHPSPATRVGTAEERISTLPPREGLVRQTDAFLRFQRSVESLHGAPGRTSVAGGR